jgi:hypothetical protein
LWTFKKAVFEVGITKQERTQGEGLPGCSPRNPPNPKVKKKTDFIVIMMSKVLRELPFSQNQPLKSADD